MALSPSVEAADCGRDRPPDVLATGSQHSIASCGVLARITALHCGEEGGKCEAPGMGRWVGLLADTWLASEWSPAPLEDGKTSSRFNNCHASLRGLMRGAALPRLRSQPAVARSDLAGLLRVKV